MEISLEGKVALVTGAGPNIGSGIALALARYGAKVACNDINPDAAKACVRRIERNDGTAMAVTGDVSEEDDVKAYLGEVLERWGRIDILINNAAILGGRGLLEESAGFFNRAVTVAAAGNFLNSKHAAIAMIERGIRGSIVSILSSNAWQGAGGVIAYAFHKGGLANFVRAAAMDLAPYGIRVNSFSPTAPEPDNPELIAERKARGVGTLRPPAEPPGGPQGLVAAGRPVRRPRHDPDGGAIHADRHRPLRRVDVLGLRAPHHRLRLRGGRRCPRQVLGLYPGGAERRARPADTSSMSPRSMSPRWTRR